jgi:hypothetical protein
MKGASPSDEMVYWNGENIEDFLEFSKQVGARAIYLNESVVERAEEDEEDPEHFGETESVEAAFLLDGVFHVYEQTAPWASPEEESEELPDDATRVEVAVRENQEELTSEFLSAIRERPGPVDPSRYSIESGLREFLATKFSAPSVRRHLITPDGSDESLASLVKSVSERIATKLLAEDRALAESKVDDLVKWSRALGIKSLSKSDVDAFLLEKGVRLGGEGGRLLWTKAKLAVKTGR